MEHDAVRRPKSQDALQPGVDQLNAKLKEAEESLETERTNIGIVAPVEDSKRTAGERIARTEAELDDVMVNLQAETATIKAMKKAMGAPAVVVTNAPAGPAEAPAPSRDVIEQYNSVCGILTSLRSKEQELLSWTTTNNSVVQANQKEIANTETRRKLLEKQNPGLLAIKTPQTASSASATPAVSDPLAALNEETIKLDGLQARYQILTNLLATEKAKATVIEANESRLVDLEDESKQYRATVNTYRQRLAEAQLNDVLGPGSSEIKIIENPTPPVGNTAAVKKVYGGVIFGGLALALGLPFLIELYLDQTLKRPSDVTSKLGVPFFVSMPKIKTKTKPALLKAEKKVSLLPENAGEVPSPEAAEPAAPAPANTNGHIAPWDERHALRPFFETLRDRLMTYFEVINLTHKPKLVAVSSCSEGAGVTTTAAGLASALSETGDGNVLLVNMNVRDGEAHHFYRGKLTCGLEEALEKNTRNAACIQDNLFIAKDLGENDNLPRVLPKRFSHLVPKMRASDYDYIIFDMPAMSQISITPRLARYMDMILLVIESEKTDRDAAKRATNLLLESKSNVGVVLNKSREYLPRRLQQDI
jgi:Mrp family chromosome partitioning ATPase